MKELEQELYGETDRDFVQREIAKAFLIFAEYLKEDRLNGGLTAERQRPDVSAGDVGAAEVSEEPQRGSNLSAPSTEPAPWEVDDGRLGGDSAQTAYEPNGQATQTAVSPEPTKETQPRLRLQGNIGRVPSFSVTSRGTPRITFPLATHEQQEDGSVATQWHSVYSTKNFAQAINAQELRKGEEVRVVGVKHRKEKRGRDGKPLVDTNGEIQTEPTIYAYSVKRVNLDRGGKDTD